MQFYYEKMTTESKKDRIHSLNYKGKLVKTLVSRQMYSPFRSAKQRTTKYPSNQIFLPKYSKISSIRSKISNKIAKSELYQFKPDLSLSTTDSITLKFRNNPEEDINIIKTPTTIQEEDSNNTETIEESLNLYFNSDIRHMNFTPVLYMATPDTRTSHRYTYTMPLYEIKPFRSETPEIPTRNKQDPLPQVNKKQRVKNTKKKNLSPQHTTYKIKPKFDYQTIKNPYFLKK
jgi:hypothetical protein